MHAAEFTGLVIPVREADPLVRAHRFGARAHVTLLAPFAEPDAVDDGMLGELDRFFGDVTGFGFTLTDVCVFPGGAVYLAPEPATAFRRLTAGLQRLFPEFPPYGGAFDDVVPHLTVELPGGAGPEEVRKSLTDRLPLEARASRAELVIGSEERIRETLFTFPFGTTAA